jgi:hypothetical protein
VHTSTAGAAATAGSAPRLDEARAVVAGAELMQRAVVRSELVHAGGEAGQLAGHDVDVDVVERAVQAAARKYIA